MDVAIQSETAESPKRLLGGVPWKAPTPEHLPSKRGVYLITNRVNQKRYVGSTIHKFGSRWGLHRHQLRNGIHENKHLQFAWTKYGEENFVFSVLAVCARPWCRTMENFYINKFDSANQEIGYNIHKIPDSSLGHKKTPEEIEKIRARMTGIKCSDETRAKMSASAKARRRSPESIAKGRASNTGKKRSPEIVAQFRLIQSNRSPEWRANISSAQKAAWASGRQTSHQDWRKNYVMSEDTKAKIGKASMGRLITEVTHMKLRQRMLTRWVKIKANGGTSL